VRRRLPIYLKLAAEVARRVETLKNKVKWTEELVETLRKLQETLRTVK